MGRIISRAVHEAIVVVFGGGEELIIIIIYLVKIAVVASNLATSQSIVFELPFLQQNVWQKLLFSEELYFILQRQSWPPQENILELLQE